MAPIDVIHIELARIRERVAELQIEERALERVLLDLLMRHPEPATDVTAVQPPSQSAPSVEQAAPAWPRNGEHLKTWTEAEDELLRSRYPLEGIAVCHEHLPHRSVAAIRTRLHTLHVKRGPAGDAAARPKITKRAKNDWSDEDVAILTEHYPAGGMPAVRPLLPNHSHLSIKTKAQKLGLKAEGSAKTKCLWSAEEDQVIVDHYPSGGVKAVHALLPHRSEQSIYNRVSHKGVLRARQPVGVEPPKPVVVARQTRTFEEQLQRVAHGAGIIEFQQPGRPGPDMTLGGVTGPIL